MKLGFRLLQPHQVRVSLSKSRSFRFPQTLFLQEGDINSRHCYIQGAQYYHILILFYNAQTHQQQLTYQSPKAVALTTNLCIRPKLFEREINIGTLTDCNLNSNHAITKPNPDSSCNLLFHCYTVDTLQISIGCNRWRSLASPI